MQTTSAVIFKGKSETQYLFETVSIDTVFQESESAVFCVIKSDDSGNHKKIFLGETDDLERYFNPLCRYTFTERFGADAICIHRDSDQLSREKKLRDLREGNRTVYQEYPNQNEENDRFLTGIIWEVTDIAAASR